MASIVVCQQLGKEIARESMTEIDLFQNIAAFKGAVANKLKLSTEDFDLVFCGQSLKDDNTLMSYGVKSGSMLFIFLRAKQESSNSQPDPLDQNEIHQVVTALQAALLNPEYRHMVQEMLSNPETLENIVAAIPSLEGDPVAYAMLQTPELLAILADPHYIHKVLEKHPSLGHAAMHIASAVHEEGSRIPNTSQSSRETYSLDQMSDDEDMVMGRPSGGGASGSQPITTSQLAAALAIAGTSSQQAPPSSSQSPSADNITADFLRQAMMQAVAQGGSSSSSQQGASSNSSSQSMEAQLEQLRAMGITDEVAARHALEATGGDINAALQLLFDGME